MAHTPRPNGTARRIAEPLPAPFLATLEAELRACLPRPGQMLLLDVRLGRTVRDATRNSLRGVLEGTYAHGFLVRGEHYATFFTYVDLYCQEGHVAVIEPVWLRDGIAAANARLFRLLPRGGPHRPFQGPAPGNGVSTAGIDPGQVSRAELAELMRGAVTEIRRAHAVR
jgi:hypothetical protein